MIFIDSLNPAFQHFIKETYESKNCTYDLIKSFFDDFECCKYAKASFHAHANKTKMIIICIETYEKVKTMKNITFVPTIQIFCFSIRTTYPAQ